MDIASLVVWLDGAYMNLDRKTDCPPHHLTPHHLTTSKPHRKIRDHCPQSTRVHHNPLTMSAPFDPPTNFDSKPHVPQWIPPAPPTEDIDYAKLRTVDMSLLDSEDPKVVAQLVETVKGAIRDDGFLYLENFGISLEQVRHIYNSRLWS